MSLGSNENACRHLAQKPVVRPGWPSLPRPTGLPQFEQNRLSSGTDRVLHASPCWRRSREPAGSVVRPAPSRAVRSRCDSERTRRVLVLPGDAGPRGPEGGRGESVAGPRHRRRRARHTGGTHGFQGLGVAGGSAGVAVAVEDLALAAGLRAGRAVGDARRDDLLDGGRQAAAVVVAGRRRRLTPGRRRRSGRCSAPPSPGVPQTSQYPSTMVPEHPGCWQAPVRPPPEPDSAATLPGIPQTSQ